MDLVEDDLSTGAIMANPGPFHAEIDSFDLGTETFEQNVFGRVSEYKDYIKNLSGIRVYRDGFGIRVDPDWLKLGQQQTSGRSDSWVKTTKHDRLCSTLSKGQCAVRREN